MSMLCMGMVQCGLAACCRVSFSTTTIQSHAHDPSPHQNSCPGHVVHTQMPTRRQLCTHTHFRARVYVLNKIPSLIPTAHASAHLYRQHILPDVVSNLEDASHFGRHLWPHTRRCARCRHHHIKRDKDGHLAQGQYTQRDGGMRILFNSAERQLLHELCSSPHLCCTLHARPAGRYMPLHARLWVCWQVQVLPRRLELC